MSETVRNKPEHRHIEFGDINLIPCLVAIKLPDKNIQVGHGLFLHNGVDHQAILWHIYVDKKYRRQGFASAILDHAKQVWEEIATDWTSGAGHDLCIKNGFQLRKADMLRLIWKRKD